MAGRKHQHEVDWRRGDDGQFEWSLDEEAVKEVEWRRERKEDMDGEVEGEDGEVEGNGMGRWKARMGRGRLERWKKTACELAIEAQMRDERNGKGAEAFAAEEASSKAPAYHRGQGRQRRKDMKRRNRRNDEEKKKIWMRKRKRNDEKRNDEEKKKYDEEKKRKDEKKRHDEEDQRRKKDYGWKQPAMPAWPEAKEEE